MTQSKEELKKIDCNICRSYPSKRGYGDCICDRDPKPDINKVKCSCGQYYAILDHCCYPWVGDFNRECGFIFSGSLGQLHKEKVKDFIRSALLADREMIKGEVEKMKKQVPIVNQGNGRNYPDVGAIKNQGRVEGFNQGLSNFIIILTKGNE